MRVAPVFSARYGAVGFVGVAEHADFDAVDFLDQIALILGVEISAGVVDALFVEHLHRALHAAEACVVGVVIGGEQHVKISVDYRIHNGVGRVKGGIAGVFFLVARQRGFQIGDGVVGLIRVILYVSKDTVKIVCRFGTLGAFYNGVMADQVARDRNGGFRDFRDFFRLVVVGFRNGRRMIVCAFAGGQDDFTLFDEQTPTQHRSGQHQYADYKTNGLAPASPLFT